MSVTAVVKSGADLVHAGTGEVVGSTTFSMVDYLASVNTPAAFETQKRLAAAYDAACLSLIGENDVQKEGARTFKKKSAWRKLARHFSISTVVVRVEREFFGEGDFLAMVTVKALGPWGQSAEAVGACGTDEETGKRKITIADAIATAETRATNRATSNLIAMGEVSAEEIGDRESHGDTRGEGRASGDNPPCPKCGGRTWDNRLTKRNPNAPDYKCRDRNCDGVLWPPKEGEQSADPTTSGATSSDNTPPTSTRNAPDSTSTPTQGTPSTERITLNTPWPNGKHKGTLIKDLPPDFLVWATEDGRKFGEATAALQDACRLQLDELRQQAEDAASDARRDDDDDLPF